METIFYIAAVVFVIVHIISLFFINKAIQKNNKFIEKEHQNLQQAKQGNIKPLMKYRSHTASPFMKIASITYSVWLIAGVIFFDLRIFISLMVVAVSDSVLCIVFNIPSSKFLVAFSTLLQVVIIILFINNHFKFFIYDF